MARTRFAAEGARMTSKEPSPPRWAETLLRSLLRPSDRESISGDLLEEYRAARRPALGALRANAWYIKHVLSVFWHLIRPCALGLAGLTLLSLIVKSWSREAFLGYGSLVQAPGLSLLHALVYLWAGYHGSQRTRLIRTGMLAAGGTGFVGFTVLFVAAVIRFPSLLIAPFSKPFIFVILSVLLLLMLSYSVVVGTVGGIIGRWCTPSALREVRAS
jgi:hypothetical protein